MSKNMQKARKVKEENQQLIEKLVTDTGYSKRGIKAARKIGCSAAQIMAVASEDLLWALITKVDPKLLPDMSGQDLQKAAKTKISAEPMEMVSRKKDLLIELSPQAALTWKRGDYEQSELDRFVSRNGIKNLVRVVINRRYVPTETSKYETEITIYYKEPK